MCSDVWTAGGEGLHMGAVFIINGVPWAGGEGGVWVREIKAELKKRELG